MINIYKALALRMTKYYADIKVINKSESEVYKYGFEVLLSSLAYTFVFIITALITKTLFKSVLFWLGFFIIRTICGGYHANSYTTCHILFFINHLLFIFIIKICSIIYFPLQEVLIIFSTLSVILIGPIAHPNKPFIKTEKERFVMLSRYYSALLLVIYSINYFFVDNDFGKYTLSFAIGTFSAAISLIGAKLIYKKGGQK